MLQTECFTILLLAVSFANTFASDEQQVIFFFILNSLGVFIDIYIYHKLQHNIFIFETAIVYENGMRLRDQDVLLQRGVER